MSDLNDPFMRNQNAAVQARTKAQNRSNVLQLKLMGQSHPTGLTPNLLKLFEPRPPLDYLPPPEKRKCPPYSGMAQFVSKFAEPGDPEYAPPKPEVETPAQKRERIHKLRLEKGVEKAAEELLKYDPNSDPNASGDPYKTLFVSRLNYETSESKIKREFESYGPIKRVHLVTDQLTNKPKGYAFIEYMHTRDMKAAYKQADGRKIDGRRVLVDVERGRTVPNWRPRRLGGGLGTSRVAGEKIAGEEQPGRLSRSEEPRAREDREKSRDRGKEREREQSHDRPRERSRELSHERSVDRTRESHKEEKHHRDRDRGRDRDRDRDRERESRRDRDRDRGDRDRRDRTRDHDRDRSSRRRDRDYETVEYEDEGGRSHEKEVEYERSGSKHREQHSRRGERDYDRGESEEGHGGYYEGRKRSSSHYEQYEREDEPEQGDQDRYNQYAERDNHDRYDRTEEDEYRYDDRDYKRSERSKSREYDR